MRAGELADDRAITIHSAADVAEKRRALTDHIWGADGFPDKRLPDKVTPVESPVKQLEALEGVEDLRIDMAPGLHGQAFHFNPKRGNGELVVEYETRVQAALREIVDASFRLEIDETAPGHMISHHAIEDIILPELRKAK